MEEKKGVRRGYSIRTFESPLGISRVLERDCGDCIEITHLKGVVANEPGVVAAVGGIPDELKINGGISLSFPCPTFKVPKNLPQVHAGREEALLEACKKFTGKNSYEKAFVHAYLKAQGYSLESEQLGEEDAHNIYEQPLTMLEINLKPESCGPPVVLEDILSNPIPIKQEMGVKHGYCVLTFESLYGTIQHLGRDCGDFYETTFLKGVLINIPAHYVAAVGGIPDELKLNRGISFSYPCPIFKISKPIPKDPAERERALCDAYDKAMGTNTRINAYRKALKNAVLQAYKNVKVVDSFLPEQSEEAHNTGLQPCTMIEVNVNDPFSLISKPAHHVAAVGGTRSSSELNKDQNVEK